MMRKQLLLVSSVALIGALGAAPVVSAGTGPARSQSTAAARATGTPAAVKSAFWAGYVASPPANARNDYFKYVTATFAVPAIAHQCQGADFTDVGQYAGLSGNWVPTTDAPLQAAGLYESCNPTSPKNPPVYHAAYWNIPDNGSSNDGPGEGDGPTMLFTVKPGDVIVASVHFSGPLNCPVACQEHDTWRVADQTTGHIWQKKLPCFTDDVSEGVASCDTNTAEVITQGEVLNRDGIGTFGTPDFGKISFSAIKATDYQQTSAQALTNSAWTTTKVTEYGIKSFRPDVTPGPLTSTTNPPESAFTNTWHRLS